jgi:hypothetical protein
MVKKHKMSEGGRKKEGIRRYFIMQHYAKCIAIYFVLLKTMASDLQVFEGFGGSTFSERIAKFCLAGLAGVTACRGCYGFRDVNKDTLQCPALHFLGIVQTRLRTVPL